MLALGGAIGPLSGRSWPDSPEAALANLIVLVCAVVISVALIALAGWFLWWWAGTNRPNAYRRRLEKRSAKFRARWPQEQLTYAPFVELSNEAQRCWTLILMREDSEESSDVAGLSNDVSELRHWVDAVVGALNSAADQDRQAAIGRYFE
ncbi:hypothetical protein [Mycolicibacterium farcinogenes]|uniref:Uncharacterized protein n=1 Tax=Mycolicibacterium farcinogenes TaxID=1802 RepID=A0ACD1FHA6_MYCFR|nr:hypothetical protein [Mycolicibacterium farcinogenes]QZH66295.1 hypothetical protein K6L26_00780 [Mycolicibacterium farcinogenes]